MSYSWGRRVLYRLASVRIHPLQPCSQNMVQSGALVDALTGTPKDQHQLCLVVEDIDVIRWENYGISGANYGFL